MICDKGLERLMGFRFKLWAYVYVSWYVCTLTNWLIWSELIYSISRGVTKYSSELFWSARSGFRSYISRKIRSYISWPFGAIFRELLQLLELQNTKYSSELYFDNYKELYFESLNDHEFWNGKKHHIIFDTRKKPSEY